MRLALATRAGHPETILVPDHDGQQCQICLEAPRYFPMPISTEDIIEDARNGRMFILVDHEDPRE
jgi:hypothetical protein